MKYLFILLTGLSVWPLAAQMNTMCGNGDFESGQIDPAEWRGYWVNNIPTQNVPPTSWISGIVSDTLVSSNSCPPANLQAHHTIVASGNDPILETAGVNFSMTPGFPIANNYAVRIGNTCTGRGHEMLEKTFVVQSGQTKLSFWYALVMQKPHNDSTDPGFEIRILDQSNQDHSYIVNLYNNQNFVLASDNNENFFDSIPSIPQYSPSDIVVYRRWHCAEINLDSFVNQQITVQFHVWDCLQGAHWAYAYLDNICLGCTGSPDGSIDLTAQSDSCGLPGSICIDYTLPNAGDVTGDVELTLTLLQNGIESVQMNSPVLTSGNQYCFDLNTGNLSALNIGLGGFDFVVEGHFTIPDAQGNPTVLPPKTIGSLSDGTMVGQNNDFMFTCFNECEKLSVSASSLGAGRCCYSIDINNDLGSNIAYMEANLASPDWVFASGATPGPGFSWFGTPGPNSLPIAITGPGGNPGIPVGISEGALVFCVESAVADPGLPQTVVFTWYEGIAGAPGYSPICLDSLTFSCRPDSDSECLTVTPVVTCNPDSPYEYFVNFTVTNNTSFTATHVALDNLADPVDFGFSSCTPADHLASIIIPLTPPLAPNATSGLLCVKIHSANPVLSPTVLNFYAGLITPDECCTNEEQVSISLEPCCDPCNDIQMVINPLENDNAQCCFSLDIENNCAYDFFKKVETVILTPGVQFGYHALGGPNAGDWSIGASTATSILWQMNGGASIPPGTTMDLIQFCLDDIHDASQTPQLVSINWITQDQFGRDSIACSDTLAFNCQPVVDYTCLLVTDQLLECVPDSGIYCYTFTATNLSDIPFAATNLDLFEVSGANIDFIGGGGTFPLPPLGQGDSIRLSACFVPEVFPMDDSALVFQYRLRYLMGDTCCYESIRDTIAVPDCFPDTIPHDCCYPGFIQMPTGFSPNGDGLNDFFVIRGIEHCEHVTLTVFNRWGNIVYRMDDYDNSWDGSNKDGQPLPQGTYYILLTLHDSGSSVAGFVDLRRQ